MADGIVYEGYVMPAPEQVAAAVMRDHHPHPRLPQRQSAEQGRADGGQRRRLRKYRSYSGPHKLLEQHLLANLVPLPAPAAAGPLMFDFPPIEMELPLLGVQCDQVATDKGVAWKMAGAGKVKWQVVYTFTPGDPAWHEPLADDDSSISSCPRTMTAACSLLADLVVDNLSKSIVIFEEKPRRAAQPSYRPARPDGSAPGNSPRKKVSA
ncbi:MAG: hypothetical protein M9927_23895 [Anaerolineae bacterium]|nr:hypothetical protein [Anaerolineae bacterium]